MDWSVPWILAYCCRHNTSSKNYSSKHKLTLHWRLVMSMDQNHHFSSYFWSQETVISCQKPKPGTNSNGTCLLLLTLPFFSLALSFLSNSFISHLFSLFLIALSIFLCIFYCLSFFFFLSLFSSLTFYSYFCFSSLFILLYFSSFFLSYFLSSSFIL